MKIALLTAAIVSSAYGTSCLADEINRTPGSPGFLTASLTQATNGAPAGSISTKGIVGTISTGEDNCNIYISGLKFDITTKNNSDPKIRFYGITPTSTYGFPIQDNFFPSNLIEVGKDKFTQTFNSTYVLPIARTGEGVGGASYPDFYAIQLFSDTYKWTIATANFGALPINKKPTNPGPTNPGTTNPGQGTQGGNQSGSFNNAPLTVVMATVMVIAVCAQFF